MYKGYKRDKIEMRVDRVEVSDFPLYLNTVAGGLDRRDQTIGGFSFVVKIYAVPVVEIIGQLLYLLGRYDGQRSRAGSSRSAGIGRNQAALGAIYQPAARLCVSLQRPAERKNVIYQTRCQEPYSASGTFFVDFCEFDEKVLDNLSLERPQNPSSFPVVPD